MVDEFYSWRCFIPGNPSCVAAGTDESWNSSSIADRRVGEEIARPPLQRAIFYTHQNGQTLAGYGDFASTEDSTTASSGQVTQNPVLREFRGREAKLEDSSAIATFARATRSGSSCGLPSNSEARSNRVSTARAVVVAGRLDVRMEQVGMLRGRRQVGRLNLLFILPKGGFYLLKSLAADFHSRAAFLCACVGTTTSYEFLSESAFVHVEAVSSCSTNLSAVLKSQPGRPMN